MRSYKATIKTPKGIVQILVAAPDLELAKREAARKGRLLKIRAMPKIIFGGGMSIADRTVFFQRLSSMVASQVSMSEALSIIHSSFGGTVREAAAILRQHIEAGASLPEAMGIAGTRFFPEAVQALIRTGSHGGNIAHALREAARFELELESVKKESSQGVWSASFGFLTGVVTLFGSTLYVGPMIMQSDMMKLGKSAVDIGWVNTLSTSLNWTLGLIIGILLTSVFALMVMRPIFPSAVDRLILRIPFYRDLVLAKQNYIVFFGLGILLGAGLRLEECLRLSRDNSPRGELRDDLERARKTIVGGSSKPWPFVMTTLHPTDKAALATAQDRKQIGNTIAELAIQYRNLYRHRVGVFVPALQIMAAIFLSLAGVVLFGVSIIPLLQMTSGILGGA